MQLASRSYLNEKRTVKFGGVTIGGNTRNTVLIGGPCSVESEEQIRESAELLVKLGLTTLRGGCYKPRTSPYSFQGLGLEGLKLLAKMREEYGLNVITEARDATHIDEIIEYTDVIQVAVLIIGGLATTYMALIIVSEKFGLGRDVVAGFNTLLQQAPDHFHMILEKPGPDAPQEQIDKYMVLPGISMYFAGQWIVNLNYWGCNQYITQRALGADLQTARTGILFAAFLKLMMPVIVMLPGIAAYVLYKNGHLPQLAGGSKDGAYSAILGFLPSGLKGLSIAALTAAIVASLAGKVNSISTIFTLDIFKKYMRQDADEQKLVWIGRIVIFVSMFVAV